jgi:hypothetical protein
VLLVPRPTDTVLLDVTLQREGQVRRWTIVAWEHGWRCTLIAPGSITATSCNSHEQALDRKREWEFEIAAARADGWN